jgi:hypothetical protein
VANWVVISPPGTVNAALPLDGQARHWAAALSRLRAVGPVAAHLAEQTQPGPDALVFTGVKGGPLRRSGTGSELSPGVEIIPYPLWVMGRLQRVSTVRRPRR